MESATTRRDGASDPPFPSELLPELIRSLPDGLLLFAAGDAPPLWHNPQVGPLLGLSADELAGTTWRQLVQLLHERSSTVEQPQSETRLPAELLPDATPIRGRIAQHVESAGLMRLRVLDWSLRTIGSNNDRWLFMVIDVSPQHAIEQEGRRSETALQNVVSEQQNLLYMLRQLGTPVLPIHEGIVVLPLIGHIDSARADHVMEAVLAAIVRYQAQVVLIDITGVSLVDTAVANSLIQTVRAAHLLGTLSILVGISAEVARSMVQLGVQLNQMVTQRDLQAGIGYALRHTGCAIVRRSQEVDWVATFAAPSQE